MITRRCGAVSSPGAKTIVIAPAGRFAMIRPRAWSSARTAAARTAAAPGPVGAGTALRSTAVSGQRASAERLAAAAEGR